MIFEEFSNFEHFLLLWFKICFCSFLRLYHWHTLTPLIDGSFLTFFRASMLYNSLCLADYYQCWLWHPATRSDWLIILSVSPLTHLATRGPDKISTNSATYYLARYDSILHDWRLSGEIIFCDVSWYVIGLWLMWLNNIDIWVHSILQL
jgi:hypothetical protein